MPVNRVLEGDARTPTTVGDALAQLREEHIGDISCFLRDLAVETSSGKAFFEGAPFNVDLLQVMLNLNKAGVNPFEAKWFFYDSDASVDGDFYYFFAVHGHKIVAERIGFMDYRDSGFDPAVFSDPSADKLITISEPYWDEAMDRFWYRKFYMRTMTGQLMVLRPDKPELHFYVRPEERWSSLETQLRNISGLLALAVLLLGFLALMLLRR